MQRKLATGGAPRSLLVDLGDETDDIDKRLLLGRGGLGALPSVLGFGFVFGVLGVCLSVHSRISAPH